MKYLLSAIIAAAVSIASLVGIQHQQQQTVSPAIQQAIQQYVDESIKAPNFGTTLPIAGQTYNLAGSGVSQTGTTITLASFTVTQTGQKIRDVDLSDTFFITLEPGNPAKQEIASCTTDVQNANGSASFSGCIRGLSPITPYTASSSLQFSHGGGTQVIFSNPPQFYNQFALLDNANTFTATNTYSGSTTFATSPTLTTDCTGSSANSAICAKAYIDNVAVSGAPNANDTTKGIVETATAAEAAAGTNLGGTGARLVLGANISTSSPTVAGCASFCVVVATAGKIAQAFFDLTAAYVWTGLHTFNGGFIDNASSTVTSTFNINGALNFQGTSISSIAQSATTTTYASNSTWTKPSGAKVVFLQMWGGGGSGAVTSNICGAGGGGGGQYWEQWFTAANLTSTESITVGAGGTGVSNPSTGNTGGNSAFGGVATSTGGNGGVANSSGTGNGGSGGAPPSVSATAGFWAIGSSGAGSFGLYSGAGGASGGQTGGNSYYGGAGGGGGQSGGGGAGGTSSFGGAGGAGGSSSATSGSVPGGGGGGSCSGSGTGAGGAGRVTVTTFF